MTKFAFGFLYLLWPIFSQPLRPMPQMLGVKISDGVRS